MKALLGILRSFFVSFEMVVAGLPFVSFAYQPKLWSSIYTLIGSDWKWLLGVTGLTATVFVYCVKQADSVLSPKGKRVIILDWPDYGMLKRTVIVALCLGILAIASSIAGVMLCVALGDSLGLPFQLSGLLQIVVTAASLILATWKSRELLRE